MKKFSIFHIPFSIEFIKINNFRIGKKWQMINGKWQIPKGFTLIELLIVIAIISLLSTFTFANFLNARERARDTQRKSDLRQLQAAFELYRADQDTYPASIPVCGTALSAGGNTYMQKIPCDPTNSGQYIYTYVQSGSTYQLFACLENANDPQKDTTNNSARCNGGTDNWSYTLTNP
jgi:general secretion pathway protein G